MLGFLRLQTFLGKEIEMSEGKRTYRRRPGSNPPGRKKKEDQGDVKVRYSVSVHRRIMEEIHRFAAAKGLPPSAVAGDCLKRYFGAYKGMIERRDKKAKDKAAA